VGDLLQFTARLVRTPRHGLLRAKTATDWYEQGCALEDSDPVRAIAAYRRALVSRPAFADAHCNLGRLLHERADLAGAEHHYREAITADPGVGLYWFNLGVVVEDRYAGAPAAVAEALDAYGRALALDPSLADAHYNLARLYEQLGKRSGDDLMLRRAIRHLVEYRARERSGAQSSR
jgi:tetratricopeptide (TPR) repeat protein